MCREDGPNKESWILSQLMHDTAGVKICSGQISLIFIDNLKIGMEYMCVLRMGQIKNRDYLILKDAFKIFGFLFQ